MKKTAAKHPISDGLPAAVRAQDRRALPELGDGARQRGPRHGLFRPGQGAKGTGKDEPIIWVNTYGKGRVYNNALGHDVEAMSDPNFQSWLRRGVIWAATGKAE